MQNTSGAFSLDLTDVKKLGIHALLVGVAAALTVAVDSLGSLNLGAYTAVVVPIVSIGLNTALKWIRANDTTETK